MNPVPENPIQDTVETQRFLEQFAPEERPNITSQLDAYRQELGLDQVTKQRLQIMQDLNSANQVFRGVVEDIKNNPDLPKGLAMRRIDEVQNKQKEIILQLSGQYDMLLEQESILNDQFNQRFDILKLEQDDFDRKEKRLFDMLNMMVDGGAIAAFSNGELATISQRLGVPEKALRNLRDQAKEEQNKPNVKTTLYSTDKGLVAIQQDETTGAVIGKPTVVVGKSPGSGSSTFTTTQSNQGAVNAGMSIEDFNKLPADVQNLFVNNSDVGQLLVDDISAYKTGDLGYQDALDDINSQNISQNARTYFTSLLGPAPAAPQGSSGGLWNWVKGLF